MITKSPLPCLSRCEFYRFHEGELVCALAQAIWPHFKEQTDIALSGHQEAVFAWAQLTIEVPNGGFIQFFYNHHGERGVEQAAQLFEALDLAKVSAVLRDAVALYRRHQLAFQVDNPWGGLFDSIPEFGKLDVAFIKWILRGDRALEKWIRAHITELANDENGEPINSQFTGAVEIKQPNGLVGEYLEVRKGKPHGAYRQFFDDGTVRKVIFYKSGKFCGDFWPDGTLQRKESKSGGLTTIEWFYPSGQLHKRYVKDKTGYAVEPVCLFHENGQLAEQITVKQRVKTGLWLKFFVDGSPKLRAEYADGAKLIIHEAWTDDRIQVVKDGSGVFRDDGPGIDWEYSVFHEHRWQREWELKEGIPHGKAKEFNAGVLWGISNYVEGVLDGESTTYWDNGRVRMVTKLTRGKEGPTQLFPKFDRPVPAVILRVEANEGLYTAWDHIRVDEYPQVLNLTQVQEQLQVPDFLREIHERNSAGSPKSEYEESDTFNDGIAYFLTVNEAGEVTSAIANGSGAYSGGSWNIYPPLLRKLRFSPGRIRGRAVECRVLANVDHTFVES